MKYWVDGACFPNPGKGGWGWTDLNGNSASGGELQTTNNRMEIRAAIECLRFCKEKNIQDPLIVTDSRYVIGGAVSWRNKWEKGNWKRRGGRVVVNQDLWKELYVLCDEIFPRFEWVRGHTGDPGNEAADQLASVGSSCSPEEIERAKREFRK